MGIAAIAAATTISTEANATPSYCETVSGNLIQNCGFETGDLTGWGTQPAASGSLFGPSNFANTGNFSVAFGAVDQLFDTITQVFTTIPGHTYSVQLAFWSDGSTPNAAFTGWFDGSYHLLGGGTNLPAYNWITADWDFVASGFFAGLVISGYDTPSYVYVDDVVVRDVSAPEPITLSVFAAGLAWVGAARRRKNQSRA